MGTHITIAEFLIISVLTLFVYVVFKSLHDMYSK